MEDDLEQIRRKKLQQLQEQQGSQYSSENLQAAYQQEQANAEREAQKQAIMRQILTPEARERLTTLKMSRTELAEQLESQLVMLAQNGRIQSRIDDEQLKHLLQKMMPKKKDQKITHI
ncbi:DNA-binding protein [Methanosalsum natronophilum]|uniref:DNA-binding protein D5R95_08845 n=1 Tax=Methanosalsum natronophilum TaxID=768733 RepID=A0A3R7WAL7_9EURY|nr:DNA-binding protein [Methanosalsum natronophilum]MCS3922997.1 programmed cell death protein 5 [Methanosalsum natronophilum]RQD80390.1 MAG: DNA-binding protein [Methanosalsum natronophilum]